MFWLILNLWLMGFVFLGCIIQCLDSTYKNLENINDKILVLIQAILDKNVK